MHLPLPSDGVSTPVPILMMKNTLVHAKENFPLQSLIKRQRLLVTPSDITMAAGTMPSKSLKLQLIAHPIIKLQQICTKSPMAAGPQKLSSKSIPNKSVQQAQKPIQKPVSTPFTQWMDAGTHSPKSIPNKSAQQAQKPKQRPVLTSFTPWMDATGQSELLNDRIDSIKYNHETKYLRNELSK